MGMYQHVYFIGYLRRGMQIIRQTDEKQGYDRDDNRISGRPELGHGNCLATDNRDLAQSRDTVFNVGEVDIDAAWHEFAVFIFAIPGYQCALDVN